MILHRHPLSSAYPDMQDDEYEKLVKSIDRIGLQNPIVLFEGMIIDGWHRYLACADTHEIIKTIELASDVSPQDYVVSQNENRRHLTQSQLAYAAIKVYEWRKEGSNNLPNSAQYAELGEHNKINDLQDKKTAAQIAKLAGVSTRTIEQAKQIETNASKEIKKAVANGEISVATAVKKMQPETKPKNDENEYTELDKLRDENSELKDIISDLQHQISIASYDGAEPIEDIVKDLKITKANLKQLTISRNGLQNELAAAKRQIIAQRKEIDRLKK